MEIEVECPNCMQSEEYFTETADGILDRYIDECVHCGTEFSFKLEFEPVVFGIEQVPDCKYKSHEFNLYRKIPKCDIYKCIHCNKLDYRQKES